MSESKPNIGGNIPAQRWMNAARVHEFGSIDAIKLEHIEIPAPGPNEVLVRVEAAGVGPWDAWVRAGKSALPQPLPLTLGSDIAGVVDRVGNDVSAFKSGDAVYGVTNGRFTGAYADYAIASAGMIAKKPANLSDIEAASAPVVAVTAWQMLFDHAKLKEGQTVFIHGGSGNVGAYAVQLALKNGIAVVASAKGNDGDALRRYGDLEIVDAGSPTLDRWSGRCDAIIDTVGGPSADTLYVLGRRGGALVSSVAPPDADKAKQHDLRASFFIVDVNTAILTRLAKLFEEGKISPTVGSVLPLSEARVAHEMLEGRRPRLPGKIILQTGA